MPGLDFGFDHGVPEAVKDYVEASWQWIQDGHPEAMEHILDGLWFDLSAEEKPLAEALLSRLVSTRRAR